MRLTGTEPPRTLLWRTSSRARASTLFAGANGHLLKGQNYDTGTFRSFTLNNQKIAIWRSYSFILCTLLLDNTTPVQLTSYFTTEYEIKSSVTRCCNLLDFGQLFKAFGNNYFAQISHILKQFLWSCQNISFFLVKSFLGNFYRHLATFHWSHWSRAKFRKASIDCGPILVKLRKT